MRQYPHGAKALFMLHRITGIGVHELYEVSAVRWAVNLLDRLTGTPPT